MFRLFFRSIDSGCFLRRHMRIPSKRADTKTDWGQSRLINGASLSYLQKQGFIGLLERRPLGNTAPSAAPPFPTARAEAVIDHWKLLCGRPFLLDLAAQLYLRRHEFMA